MANTRGKKNIRKSVLWSKTCDQNQYAIWKALQQVATNTEA
jgi:hypothetical protein